MNGRTQGIRMNRDLKTQIQNLVRIGIALSSERDIDVLLEMIVDESRRFTLADGGTLYVVSSDGLSLDWKILQSDTMGTRKGGTSGEPIHLPPVPLLIDGQPNQANVSAHVANTGETVSISDVYEAEGFDFSGTRAYDESAGYRSRSMLVVPMRNHEDDIIGVLQLINASDPDGKGVVAFSSEFEDLVASLASQAAVALTNVQLIIDLENLFDAFIEATAIDEKSPYTAGHVRRVADLTMEIAREINRRDDGDWTNVHFTEEELNELRIAAWMHDVGKITTPEYVVDKSTKLETIHDRLEAVRTRWELLKRDAEISALKSRLKALGEDPDGAREEVEEVLSRLDEEIAFIAECNAGGEFMADDDVERLKRVGEQRVRLNGEAVAALSEDELKNLSIRKGTLTEEERNIICNHAAVTIKMLSQLPFSKALSRVAEYAGGHHEKLNGKGYPQGLGADQLALQARVLAVADVFEALTAPDRPYRKPMPLSKALRILNSMVEEGELDERVVALVRSGDVLEAYAAANLQEDQVDI